MFRNWSGKRSTFITLVPADPFGTRNFNKHIAVGQHMNVSMRFAQRWNPFDQIRHIFWSSARFPTTTKYLNNLYYTTPIFFSVERISLQQRGQNARGHKFKSSAIYKYSFPIFVSIEISPRIINSKVLSIRRYFREHTFGETFLKIEFTKR